MSQYQYVTFRAIDRPLDDKQLAFAERQSSHSELSRREMSVEYIEEERVTRLIRSEISLNPAQPLSGTGLYEEHGSFQTIVASSDLPAIDRGEFDRRLVYPLVLRMDRVRPKPSFAATLEGALVDGNRFGSVLPRSSVVTHQAQNLERRPDVSNTIFRSLVVDTHRWHCHCHSRDRQKFSHCKWDTLRWSICIADCVGCSKSAASNGCGCVGWLHDIALRLDHRIPRSWQNSARACSDVRRHASLCSGGAHLPPVRTKHAQRNLASISPHRTRNRDRNLDDPPRPKTNHRLLVVRHAVICPRLARRPHARSSVGRIVRGFMPQLAPSAQSGPVCTDS
jgi:hypothetical protein